MSSCSAQRARCGPFRGSRRGAVAGLNCATRNNFFFKKKKEMQKRQKPLRDVSLTSVSSYCFFSFPAHVLSFCLISKDRRPLRCAYTHTNPPGIPQPPKAHPWGHWLESRLGETDGSTLISSQPPNPSRPTSFPSLSPNPSRPYPPSRLSAWPRSPACLPAWLAQGALRSCSLAKSQLTRDQKAST
jgi:hypothetical protein